MGAKARDGRAKKAAAALQNGSYHEAASATAFIPAAVFS